MSCRSASVISMPRYVKYKTVVCHTCTRTFFAGSKLVFSRLTLYIIKATIPTNDGLSADLGSGWMDYQYVPTQSDFNFTYPFAIEYDPTASSSNEMLNTLIDKCGLNGGDPQDINIYYTIHLVAKVLFVTVHPTITSSASFACPLKVCPRWL